MLLSVVAGGVDPQDPVCPGVGGDGVRRSGHTGPVASTRVEPASGMVDDLCALTDRILLGERQVDLRVDADQQELRPRCHLVHDLRDCRSVVGRRGKLTSEAVVDCVRRTRECGRVAGEAVLFGQRE